jgi:hypothetical protein
LRDHLHCSVFRHYPKDPPTLDRMAESLGPAYKNLLPAVKSRVPEQYRIVMAHQCGYAGRRFVHLTLRDGAHLISLVISRKQAGETLGMLSPAVTPGGIPVYGGNAGAFQLAAFETADFLAFVVSDLDGASNLRIAGEIAPEVHRLLAEANV